MPAEPRFCPFIADPFPECHVADWSSQSVEKAIQYCGGDYHRCEIYNRRMAMRKEG